MTALAAPTQTGWQGELDLQYRSLGARTQVRSRHRGPLRVQRPFFPEGKVNHTYLLHPPGGVVGGDSLRVQVQVDADAHALLTTPGATKVYQSAGARASVINQLNVTGICEWLPQETIVFSGADFHSTTSIELQHGAALIAAEVVCLGRPHSNAEFDRGNARFTTTLGVAGIRRYQDRLRCQAGMASLTAAWGLRGANAFGQFYVYPADEALRDHLLPGLNGVPDAGLTRLDDLLVVRALGDQAQSIHNLFRTLWAHARPMVCGRQATPPRIWNT